MAEKSKWVQRHHNSFKEIKPERKKGQKKRLLKVPVEKENETPSQLKKRLEKIEENKARQEFNKELESSFKKSEDYKAQFRGVHVTDNMEAVFGSQHRAVRISLEESNHIDTSLVEVDSDKHEKTAEAFERILDQFPDNVTSGLVETKIFSDLLFPFLRETSVVRIHVSVLGEYTVETSHYPGAPPTSSKTLNKLVYDSEYLFDEEFRFGINVRYLHDALKFAKNLGHSTVELHFVSSVRPLLLKAEGFEYILTPVRVHG